MALNIIPPITISAKLIFFPNDEPLYLVFESPGYEELMFGDKISQNSKFFDTRFERSIQFGRSFSAGNHVDKIKLFSVGGFVPGKKQRISIEWFAIDDHVEGDFPKYCGFQMIENKFVENKFLYNQSEICFNGTFYYTRWYRDRQDLS